MDIATILGIISAFGLVMVAIFMGGGLKIFASIPTMMIVVDGTIGATMINYPLKEVLSVFAEIFTTMGTFAPALGMVGTLIGLVQMLQTMSNPGSSGLGSISPNSLEQSNTDIATEFVKMITTQRGFQANSKIITVTDQMLDELIRLKR